MPTDNSSRREQVAVASWILITMLEKNAQFFAEQKSELAVAMNSINKGIAASEQGDDEEAYRHFSQYLGRVFHHNRTLITAYDDLMQGIARLAALDTAFNEQRKPHPL